MRLFVAALPATNSHLQQTFKGHTGMMWPKRLVVAALHATFTPAANIEKMMQEKSGFLWLPCPPHSHLQKNTRGQC
jgi:hypothetical protein